MYLNERSFNLITFDESFGKELTLNKRLSGIIAFESLTLNALYDEIKIIKMLK
jgi:hypothetical protein